MDYAIEAMDSRRISISSDSLSQIMRFGIYGDFTDVAPLTGDVWNQNDDHKLLEFVYNTFPWFREFVIAGDTMILFCTAFEITPVQQDHWVIELTYDIPSASDSQSNPDAMNEFIQNNNLGPDADENGGNGWSDEFTQLSFNSSCEQRHVTTSRKVVEFHKATWLPAGMALPTTITGAPTAIGATIDGIEGTNIYERDFKFQITQYFPPSKLKYAYIRRIYRLTGCINNLTFFGFPAGSVLFLGAQGSGNLVQNVPVTFEFAVKSNFKFVTGTTTTLSNPDDDTLANMFDQLADPDFAATSAALGLPGGNGVHSGWDIVDYRYLPQPDTAAKVLFQRPAFRIIHQTQEFGDLSKLNL